MTPLVLDAVVIGGGPAGAAIGRLLASWGHAVLILDKGSDPLRGLAESLPPSTTKLLAHIGVADAIERAQFYRTRGNTVWWASRDRRVETFGPDPNAFGYQVFRPAFDRVMLESAIAAGARVESSAQVRHVALDDELATVHYESASGPASTASVRARYVIDCSGRTGVIGRRFRLPQIEFRTYAIVGVWVRDQWDLPDPTHTVVETFADGWVWSVPVNETTRHVGAMVAHALPGSDPASDTVSGPGSDTGSDPVSDPMSGTFSYYRHLTATYRTLLARAPQTATLVEHAALQRVWACDASLYSATAYAGDRFLLVGDAGSFIDPLSSFGVKKALASAWLGAVAIHTALAHPERRSIALEFFADREREMYASNLRRSREFARAANAQHPDGFWAGRAGPDADVAIDQPPDIARDPDVLRAFEHFKDAPQLHLALAENARFESHPVVRGHEIVMEPALAGGMRFHANVDLLKLAQIAPSYRHVPDVFEAYCRSCPPVPLPSVLGGLSLLVARGILYERT